MSKYEVHRQDVSAAHLIRYLRACGATYVALDRPVDGAVALPNGAVAFVEFKSRWGRLRPSQIEFFSTWPGRRAVLRSEEDVAALVQRMRTDPTINKEVER